ncbi:hypothetical protein BH24ACT5_BH24ACT5_04700 [soil metagenome]
MNVTLTQPVAQYGDEGDTIDIDKTKAEHWIAIGLATASDDDGDDAPARSATKDEWATHRAAQGHDVDGLTKSELVDLD